VNHRQPKLNRELIIMTAFSLLDDNGMEKLSMRNIAKRLNVKAMSLYNYVENKEKLLNGIVEVSICEVKIPQPSSNWESDLRNAALSFYEMLLQHPNLLPVISTHSPLTEKGIGQVEKLFLILKVVNITGLEAFSLIHIIIAYVIGYAAISITDKQPFVAIKKEMDLKKYPSILDASLELNKRNYKEEFLYGFDLILDGLSKKYTERNRIIL
jgi:TetR/AcrR family transcriptional regulator, tetracycline repressor protein